MIPTTVSFTGVGTPHCLPKHGIEPLMASTSRRRPDRPARSASLGSRLDHDRGAIRRSPRSDGDPSCSSPRAADATTRRSRRSALQLLTVRAGISPAILSQPSRYAELGPEKPSHGIRIGKPCWPPRGTMSDLAAPQSRASLKALDPFSDIEKRTFSGWELRPHGEKSVDLPWEMPMKDWHAGLG